MRRPLPCLLWALTVCASAALSAADHVNDRSALYAFDRLQRLILANSGQLGGEPSAPAISDPGAGVLARYVDYRMDTLGNFVGGPNPGGGGGNAPGRRIRGQLDADPSQDTSDSTHTVGRQNQITQVQTVTDGVSQTVPFFYDKAGNLTCDGDYYYQYDGWNRLIQVNHKGSLEFNSGNGQPTGTAGPWILRSCGVAGHG